MDRRRFLLTSVAGVLAAPLVAEAQPTGKVYRIGYLVGISLVGPRPNEAFRQGLRELGWVEGQNIVNDYRSAEGGGTRPPGRRLRAAHAALLMKETELAKALGLEGCWS